MAKTDPSEERGARRLRRIGLAFFFLVLLAFSIWSRLPLVAEGMWRDEAAAVYVARSSSLSEFLKRQRTTEYTPPLFNAIVALYGRVAGFGEASLKYFAFGLGLLALAAIAALANELFGGPASVAASLLAVNNPILVSLSAELRPYSLSVALTAASLLLVSRMRRGAARRYSQRGLLLAACLTLLAYSHIAGVLVVLTIGTVGLVALLRPASRTFGTAVASAAAAGAAVFSLWLPVSWAQFRVGIPYEPRLPMSYRWNSLLARIGQVLPDVGGWPALLAAAGMAFGVALAWAIFRTRLRLGALGFVLTVVPALSVILSLGLFSPTNRYLAIPAALLAVAAGGLLDAAYRSARTFGGYAGAVTVLAVAAILVASLAASYERMQGQVRGGVPKSGIRTLCRDRTFEDGDLVIAAPDYLASTLWYYCGSKPAIRGVALWQEALLLDWREYGGIWVSPRTIPRTLERVESLTASGLPRFFLVWDASWTGPPLWYSRRVAILREALAARYRETGVRRFGGRIEGVMLSEYSALAPPAP